MKVKYVKTLENDENDGVTLYVCYDDGSNYSISLPYHVELSEIGYKLSVASVHVMSRSFHK